MSGRESSSQECARVITERMPVPEIRFDDLPADLGHSVAVFVGARQGPMFVQSIHIEIEKTTIAIVKRIVHDIQWGARFHNAFPCW